MIKEYYFRNYMRTLGPPDVMDAVACLFNGCDEHRAAAKAFIKEHNMNFRHMFRSFRCSEVMMENFKKLVKFGFELAGEAPFVYTVKSKTKKDNEAILNTEQDVQEIKQ